MRRQVWASKIGWRDADPRPCYRPSMTRTREQSLAAFKAFRDGLECTEPGFIDEESGLDFADIDAAIKALSHEPASVPPHVELWSPG